METLKPCLLLPDGAETASTYFCIPINTCLASRSSVVKTLQELQGDLQVLEGVTTKSFLAWAESDLSIASTLPVDEIALILQVCDLLSDSTTGGWAGAFAERVKRTHWNNEQESKEVEHSMLSLSTHLQHLVVDQLGDISLTEAYFAAAVTVSGDRGLTICDKHSPHDAHELLSILANTAPASPGLRSFTCRALTASYTSANLLSNVLLQHNTISRLHLGSLSVCPMGIISPLPAAATVCLTLPSLPNLTSLTITYADLSLKDDPATAEVINTLSEAISALPHLSSFHLGNALLSTDSESPGSQSSSPLKRPREQPSALLPASCNTAQHSTAQLPSSLQSSISLDPVVAALSTAPSLTALSFASTAQRRSTFFPCRGIHGPFQSLQHLHLEFKDAHLPETDTVASTPLPVSPLPALTSLKLHYALYRAERPFMDALLACAASQPVLKKLQIEESGGGAEVLRGFGRGCGSMRHLTALQLSLGVAVPPKSARAIARWITKHVSLESLGLSLRCGVSTPAAGEQDDHTDDEDAVEGGWVNAMTVFRPLARLSRLQRLQFTCRAPSDGGMSYGVDGLLSADLAMLTQITALELDSRSGVTALDAVHLTLLPDLADLRLEGLDCEDVSSVKTCLAPLTRLTRLALSVDLRDVKIGYLTSNKGIDEELVQCFAESVYGMERLVFASFGKHAARDPGRSATRGWIRGLVHLPPWGKYTMHCRNVGIPEQEYEEVRRQLIERGAAVSRCCEEIAF